MMGRRMGLAGSARSMITTCAVSPTFSLTQMNLSDSIVSVAKPICCTLIPMFWSCRGTGEEKRKERRERQEKVGSELNKQFMWLILMESTPLFSQKEEREERVYEI